MPSLTTTQYWEVLAIIAAASIGAAMTFLFLRRLLGWLLGPIFIWETVRLARKGHTFWLRVIFAFLFLAILYTSKPDIESIQPGTLGSQSPTGQQYYIQSDATTVFRQFAEEFSKAFMLTLAIGTMLVAPMYFATAISEEKQRRSIDFLLTTHANNREIVLGKFAARLLNLVGIILAGLPVLALTQLWGGVDWLQIVIGFGTIIVAVICYGCMSTFCSVAFARTRNAVLAAYGLVLLFNVIAAVIGEASFASPIMQLIRRRDIPFITSTRGPTIWSELFGRELSPLAEDLVFGVASLFVAWIFLLAAIRYFRYFARRHASIRGRVFARRSATTSATTRVPHPLTIAVNPPVGRDPMVWKEHYLGRTWGGTFLNSTLWVYVYLIQGILAVVVAFVVAYGVQHVIVRDLGYPFRLFTVLLALLVLLSVGLRMASVVSREREQQTLVSLLTTPVSSYRILRSKWVGTLLRSRRALTGLAVSFVLSGIIIQFDLYEWLLLPLTFLAHVWFVGNFGLWLSVECRSTNRAYSILLGLLLFVSGGAWITSYFVNRDSNHGGYNYYGGRGYYGNGAGFFDDELAFRDHGQADICDWLNPPQTWWRLMIRNVEAKLYLESFARYYANAPHWGEGEARQLEERKGIVGHVVGWLIYLGAGSFFAIMSYLRFCLMRPRIRPTSNWLIRMSHPALRR